jgi:hypothetical protein
MPGVKLGEGALLFSMGAAKLANQVLVGRRLIFHNIMFV